MAQFSVMQAIGLPLPLLLLLVCLSLSSGADNAASRVVRINLSKKMLPKQGELGQPVTSYYANINVGTPAKPYKMLVDVNSGEIWLPHYSLLGTVYTRLNYKDGYSKKHSNSSFKEEHETYTISYKGTELTGKAYRDLFEFKDVTESVKAAKYEQRFLAISAANNDKFVKYGVDGVISLNPWPLSDTGSDLMLVSLARANLISELKFALALSTDIEQTTTTPTTAAASEYGGELCLGGVNPKKFSGSLRYHQVHGHNKWELNLRGVMLGAESILNNSFASKALVSSSTNDIYAPAEHVKRILQLLGLLDSSGHYDESKLYELDCLKVATAPSLTFVIDDAYYVLHPLSYIRKKYDGVVFKTTTCYVAILSSGTPDKWELGTNFIANYYTVFDLKNRQIAFGARTVKD